MQDTPVQLALTELARRVAEAERKVGYERRVTFPNLVMISALEASRYRLSAKRLTLQRLVREVKELEQLVSFKMVTRRPELMAKRTENLRRLHRLQVRLKDIVGVYQPKAAAPKRLAVSVWDRAGRS